jgi:hypothetical protein
MVAQKNMVSLAKLLRIRQGIWKKYKNIGLEMFQLSIVGNFGEFPIDFSVKNFDRSRVSQHKLPCNSGFEFYSSPHVSKYMTKCYNT